MSMESVYLETTFISYLVARPSRDLIVAGHQQATHEWWDKRRSEFENCVSQVVIDEASAGDPTEVQKRLAIIGGLPVLEITEDAESLAQAIMAGGILPPHAVRDAAHVAVAAVHAIDYLLTWNCKHLANAQIARRIALVCEKLGHRMPIICTPEELMGG
jgi:predicted nucleic acid-binding protein